MAGNSPNPDDGSLRRPLISGCDIDEGHADAEEARVSSSTSSEAPDHDLQAQVSRLLLRLVTSTGVSPAAAADPGSQPSFVPVLGEEDPKSSGSTDVSVHRPGFRTSHSGTSASTGKLEDRKSSANVGILDKPEYSSPGPPGTSADCTASPINISSSRRLPPFASRSAGIDRASRLPPPRYRQSAAPTLRGNTPFPVHASGAMVGTRDQRWSDQSVDSDASSQEASEIEPAAQPERQSRLRWASELEDDPSVANALLLQRLTASMDRYAGNLEARDSSGDGTFMIRHQDEAHTGSEHFAWDSEDNEGRSASVGHRSGGSPRSVRSGGPHSSQWSEAQLSPRTTADTDYWGDGDQLSETNSPRGDLSVEGPTGHSAEEAHVREDQHGADGRGDRSLRRSAEPLTGSSSHFLVEPLAFGQGAPLHLPAEPPVAATTRMGRSQTGAKRLSEAFESWFSHGTSREPRTGARLSRSKRTTRRRAWVVVDEQGKAALKSVEKLYMTAVLGVPPRDLRVLDPFAPLPYPTSVFIRERAVVLNLEAVKAIVTRNEAFLLAVPFAELAALESHSVWGNQAAAAAAATQVSEAAVVAQVVLPARDHPFVQDLCKRIQDTGDNLPFPLRVLEACMAGAHKQIEKQVLGLELRVKQALDALVMKVSRKTLEGVHKVKSQMNKLSTRVEKLKEEIDKLLEDDDDMRALYLNPHQSNPVNHKKPGRGKQSARRGQKDSTAQLVREHSQEATHSADLSRGPHDRTQSVDASNTPGSTQRTNPMSLSMRSFNEIALMPAPNLQRLSGPLRDDTLDGSYGWDAAAKQEDIATKQPARALRNRASSRALKHSAAKGSQGQLNRMRKSKSEAQLHRGNFGAAEPANRPPSRSTSRFHTSSVQRSTTNVSAASKAAPANNKINRVRNLRAATSALPKTSGTTGVRMYWSAANKKLRRGHADVQEAEALLEVYVTSVEDLESRLVFLKERIDDTEDLINIELDSRYNELQTVNVKFHIFALGWSWAAVVVSIWGMNLCETCLWHVESGPDSNPWLFWLTLSYIFAVMVAIIIGYFMYIQARGLSFIPEFGFFKQNKPNAFKPWWST